MQLHWHNEQDVMLTNQRQYHCWMLCSLIQLCYDNTWLFFLGTVQFTASYV